MHTCSPQGDTKGKNVNNSLGIIDLNKKGKFLCPLKIMLSGCFNV